MAYTLTFDASHKVKRGGSHVKGFLRHVARDADERNGIRHTHSNPNLDGSRTSLNQTIVRGASGDWEPATSSEQIEERLEERLKAVKGNLRKDAVVLRPFIVQLDPEWFDEHCPDWRTEGLTDEAEELQTAMLDWCVATFGEDNVLAASIHLDEVSPQVHVIFTPVTEDGRLSQKDWFRGPKQLREMHDDFREHMAAEGYDVSFGRSERSREHLSSAEFQAKAIRLATQQAELESDQEALRMFQEQQLADIARTAKAVSEQEAEILEQLQEAAEALQEAESKARHAEDAQRAARAAQRAAEAAQSDYDLAKEKYQAVVDRITQHPAEFEDFLDRPNASGKTLRPLFENFVSKRRIPGPDQIESRHDPVQSPRDGGKGFSL
jgi:uncharacterized protein YhaN